MADTEAERQAKRAYGVRMVKEAVEIGKLLEQDTLEKIIKVQNDAEKMGFGGVLMESIYEEVQKQTGVNRRLKKS